MSSLNWVILGIFCIIFPLIIGQDVPRAPFIRLNATLIEGPFAGIASQSLSEGHFAVFLAIKGTVSFRAYKPDETRLYITSTATFTENVQWLTNTTSLRITKGGFDYIAVTTSPPMILKYDGSTFTTKLLQLNHDEGFMSLIVHDDFFMLGTCNTTLSNAYYIRYITADGRIDRNQTVYAADACMVKLYKEFLYYTQSYRFDGERMEYYIKYFNGSIYRKELDYQQKASPISSIGDFLILFEESHNDKRWFSLSLQSTRTWQQFHFPFLGCQQFETSSNTTHLTAMCINENNVAAITVVDVANFKGEGSSIRKYNNLLFQGYISAHSQPFMPNSEEIGIVGFLAGEFNANMFTTVDIALPSLQFLRNITTLENIPASLHQVQNNEYLWRRNLLHAKQFKWSNHTDEVHLTKVNLSGYNLTGPVPLNLFGLRYLEQLDLSHNKLSGPASDLIYTSDLLVINMSNNALTGCPPVIRSPETSCNFSRNMLGFKMNCGNSLCDWSHQYYSIRGLEPATPALWYWTQFKPSNIRSTSSSYLWNDLVVFAGDEKNKAVEFFNTTSGTWGILGNLYLARSYPSIAAVGPYLVISGGMSQIQPTGTVDIYNSLNNTWSVTHTEQPRGLHPALTIGDEIWLGGSSAIEILNPATRKWRVLENRQINGSVATTPYAVVTGFGMIYDRLNDKWSSFKGHPEAVVVAFEDTKVAVLSPGSNTLDILDTYGWIWSHKPKNASKALCGAHSEGHLVFLSSDFRKNYLELKLFNLSSEQWTGEPFPYREFTAQVTAFPNHKKQILFASTSLAVFTWKGFAPSFWPPIAPPNTVSAESPLAPPTAEGPVHSSQTPTISEGPAHSSPQQISPTPTMSPTSVVDQPHGESPASGDDNSAFVWIIVVAIIAVVVVVGLAFLWLRKRNQKSSSNKEEEEGLMDELTEQDSINNSQREFNPADILFSEITVGEKLGEGSFGEIYKAKWHGQTVVIKKMKPSMLNKSMMIEEALTLTSLHHKHIVLSMGISKNEETDSVILVMEYMKNGSLEDLIFRDKMTLTRQDIIRLALDVAKGLNYLHSLNPKIIHRDLKGANVLLYQNRKRAKISDFGTARFLNSGTSAAKTVIGTFGSIAPEILQEAPYNEKADIYSFGVLLFEMTTSTHLAVIFEEEKRIEKISNTVEDPQFKQLIINCCRTDPIERPSIRRCIEVLKQLKAK